MEIEYEKLKGVPLFDGIKQMDLQAMLKCLDVRVKSYKRGEMIFREGDDAEFVGLVLSGSVQIVRDDYYGNRSIMATVKEKQMFGETFSCSDMKQLPVSVYANVDTVVMLMDVRRIIRTCSSACIFHSTLIHNLLRNVVEKNLMLNQKIEFTSRKTTKEKIMAYLLAKAKECGSDSFTIEYDRQSLADYLGVERSAMSAEIGKLKREGYIEVQKSHFRILKNMPL